MPESSKKLQKLASAIYLVTGFFSDQEPLKWRLRSLSVDLVSDIVKDKIRIVKELFLLFTLAKNVGLVSDANHEILAQELSKIEHDQEKPLDSMFSRDMALAERSIQTLPKPEYIKDKISDALQKTEETGSQTRPFKDYGRVSVKKNSRQNIIINLLKRKREVMIKDVSALIRDVSEKTIQRELLSMVALGVLRKIGEKRWSRYTLA